MALRDVTAEAAAYRAETALAVVTAQRYDVAEYGAVRGTGVSSSVRTANTTAIQAAADAALAAGGVLVIKGVYECDPGITVASHLDGSAGTLRVSNTGSITALLIGSRNTGTRVQDKQIALPNVLQTGKSGTGWTGTDTGVELANLYSCQISTQRISVFSTNLLLSAYGSNGNVYNVIDLGHLENGKIGLKLQPGDSSGWVNQNTIVGGRISIASNEGSAISGARHILVGDGTNPVNNNVFLNVSVEGDGPEYHAEIYGPYNAFEYCRWEATPTRVAFNGANANSTALLYGYNAHNITFTLLNGATTSTLHYFARSGMWLPSASNGHRIQNTTSNANAALTIMPASATISSDPATEYAGTLGANYWRGKRSTEAFDRVELDIQNTKINLGRGAAAADVTIETTAANRLGLASGDAFRTGSIGATTASLPTPASGYRGYLYRTEGGTGVADGLYVCLKKADESYKWFNVLTGAEV